MYHTRARRLHSTVTLLGVLAAEMGAGMVLLDMRSWVPRPADLLVVGTDQAIHGAAWLLAGTLVLWLVVTTVAALVVRLLRLRVALPAVDWITLPPIRRLAERATAVSLVASAMAGPMAAAASEPPPIPVIVVSETPATTAQASADPVDAIAAVPIVGPVAPPGRLPTTDGRHASITRSFPADFTEAVPPIDQVAVPAPDFHRHVVVPGDSMWTITAEHLAAQLGTRPSNRQISEVWRIVMDLNRASIRSGDVDLIFPGEELLLPTVNA